MSALGAAPTHLDSRFRLKKTPMLGCVRENATAPVLLLEKGRPIPKPEVRRSGRMFAVEPCILGAGRSGPRELPGTSDALLRREKNAADAGADWVREKERSPRLTALGATPTRSGGSAIGDRGDHGLDGAGVNAGLL